MVKRHIQEVYNLLHSQLAIYNKEEDEQSSYDKRLTDILISSLNGCDDPEKFSEEDVRGVDRNLREKFKKFSRLFSQYECAQDLKIMIGIHGLEIELAQISLKYLFDDVFEEEEKLREKVKY